MAEKQGPPSLKQTYVDYLKGHATLEQVEAAANKAALARQAASSEPRKD